MNRYGTAEGDECCRNDCGGMIVLPQVKDCSCHISPPCPQCESVELTCNECGWCESSDNDYVSPEEQKRNDAMERGDYLRDRAKDERSENRKGKTND